MARTLNQTCPHCSVKNSQFVVRGFHIVASEKLSPTDFNYHVCLFLSCGGCHGGLCLDTNRTHRNSSNDHTALLTSLLLRQDGLISEYFPIDGKIYPEAYSEDKPHSLPDNISNFFDQASSNLRLENWDASAMVARKCLEVSTKHLTKTHLSDEDALSLNKKPLAVRIQKLGEKALLTKDLVELAHVIRDDGNNAAHEEEPYTKGEADALLQYTVAFLTYVFTVPEMVRAAKEKLTASTTEPKISVAGK